ncbi:hypothetical protein GCM10009718_32920 [Isoptericola halotolerans]|uniref:Uncharacterized protein n=1 Tax=Isoptericola halotolerans TaxID=300560 RepID=A0ABX2A8D8_9MICO|nr:hypothetical protein [Isoptericola halotolerans]NOV98180.1 hypothetical protein [Isoptericola halotolerans]
MNPTSRHDDVHTFDRPGAPQASLHAALVEAERTGGMVQITGPSYVDALRAESGLPDPASLPDDPDRPVGEVIDVVPGALVRQPAGSRRPDPAEVPSSSQGGLAAHIPLVETPQAARDLMAGAGIDLAGFDRALAQAREGAEEHADRPVLAAYDDGHAQGHRDGLTAALRIVARFEGMAVQTDPAYAALLGNIRDAIAAEVQP